MSADTTPSPARVERARLLVAGLVALGAAGLASFFAPVESREAAPVLGILWLFDLTLGTVLLVLWAAWTRLEPRRRRAVCRWEARLARRKLERYCAAGILSHTEATRLSRRSGARPRIHAA